MSIRTTFTAEWPATPRGIRIEIDDRDGFYDDPVDAARDLSETIRDIWKRHSFIGRVLFALGFRR